LAAAVSPGEIVARVLAAGPGGYAVSYAWAGAMAVIVPIDPVDAVITATCTAFLVFIGVVIRAFSVASVQRLFGEIVGATLLLGGLALVFRA
jgi:hypothetical protein